MAMSSAGVVQVKLDRWRRNNGTRDITEHLGKSICRTVRLDAGLLAVAGGNPGLPAILKDLNGNPQQQGQRTPLIPPTLAAAVADCWFCFGCLRLLLQPP